MADPDKQGCFWPTRSALLQAYHDTEWGVPLHNDRTLFEYLVLGGAQAGLNWEIILKRREGYRRAFDHFDLARVAAYDDADFARLLADSGIIRNRAKISSAIHNAGKVIEVQQEFGSFDRYVWQFTGGVTIHHRWTEEAQIPATSPESDALSRDMIRRGFKFAGSTICYAFMQAVGMVNDHLVGCRRWAELGGDQK
ncbi:MAG: DNA-3-methyladenine glycosylase I [Candidatus Zixiibacteriota bacterium]|nr:MAG: DNA-3-methyladenine glycosylase I [candidate division Zixibacteria bacterium]